MWEEGAARKEVEDSRRMKWRTGEKGWIEDETVKWKMNKAIRKTTRIMRGMCLLIRAEEGS